MCRRSLAQEDLRSLLTRGTDICNRCAAITLQAIYRNAAARAWAVAWRARLQQALEAARVIEDPLALSGSGTHGRR